MTDKATIHIVPHFHWDREWYLSFREFQVKLVKAVDSLLELMEKNNYQYFMFDGQVIALKDYIEIRPEKKDVLLQRIRGGRIEVGPWFVQADEFFVSGESTIRNLLTARRILEEYGIDRVMKIGYVPDQFGHISQLPQLLKKAGMDTAIFARGVLLQDGCKSEFIWKSPDGSQVLAIVLPLFYGNAETIPDTPEDIKMFMERTVTQLSEYSTVKDVFLLLNGRDHYLPQKNLPQIIARARGLMSESYDIKHSTLERYVSNMKEKLSEYSDVLEIKEGELREGPVLSNTASSRMNIKKENNEVQILMENWLEPFSMLSMLLTGTEYKSSFINKAWEILLKNHAHDGICGCSVDKVHDKMIIRYEEVKDIAGVIIEESMKNIACNICINEFESYDTMITVFNPLSWHRSEFIPVYVDFPSEGKVKSFIITDGNKNFVPFQILKVYETKIMKTYDRFIPYPYYVRRFEILMHAECGPVGYNTYFVKSDGLENKYVYTSFEDTATNLVEERLTFTTDTVITNSIDSMENSFLRVKINKNGSIDLLDKKNNNSYSSLCIFEDSGDRGDAYYYFKPINDTILTTAFSTPNIANTIRGSSIVEFEVQHFMQIPESLDYTRENRSEKYVTLTIFMRIKLETGKPYINIDIEVDNHAMDHRLRMFFPSGIRNDCVFCHIPFDVVKRPVNIRGTKYEKSTFPCSFFLSYGNQKRALTVINRGTPEYEIVNDDTIALTLLRCVDRIGVSLEAGGASMTPNSQNPGKYNFAFSIRPHGDSWENEHTYRDAYNFNVPMKAILSSLKEKPVICADWKFPGWATPIQDVDWQFGGELPQRFSMINVLEGDVILSAFKKADKNESVIMRIFNIHNNTKNVRIVFGIPVKSISETNIYENCINGRDITVNEYEISFLVGAKEIVSFEIKIWC